MIQGKREQKAKEGRKEERKVPLHNTHSNFTIDGSKQCVKTTSNWKNEIQSGL